MIWRRQAREAALKVLFQVDVGNVPIEEAVELTLSDTPELPPPARDYAKRLAEGVWKRREELDAEIQSVTRHWSTDRMASVDRNLLRVALYEILYVPDVPFRVAINEAVELARKYGTAESSRFVNGILGAIVRKRNLEREKR